MNSFSLTKLTHIEKLVLEKIKTNHQVLMIPVDLYASILHYSEVIEDYETCVILYNLIDKVKLQTVLEFYDECINESLAST